MNLNLGDLHALLDKLCFLVHGRLSRTCCFAGLNLFHKTVVSRLGEELCRHHCR
jgi:hypothetical protein